MSSDRGGGGGSARCRREGRSLIDRIQALRPKRLGLRTRMLMMFVLGALFLVVFLGAVGYSFTRTSVVNQRERTAVEQARRDAQVAQNELLGDNGSTTSVMNGSASSACCTSPCFNEGAWVSSDPVHGRGRDPRLAAPAGGQRRRRARR